MLYTHTMIASMGFDNVEAFMNDYSKYHPNCCFSVRADGVWCEYDFDSQFGFEWKGPAMIVSPTVQQVIDAMVANGTDEKTAVIYATSHTDEMLKSKVLMSNGTLWDYEVRGTHQFECSLDVSFPAIDK